MTRQLSETTVLGECKSLSRQGTAVQSFSVFRYAPVSNMRSVRTNALILVFLLAMAEMLLAAAPQANHGQTEGDLEEGIKLIAAGRYIESLAAFNRFKQSAPQDSSPYFYSAMALAQAGRMNAAALELQEAVRLAPGKLEYLVLQASVLSQLKQNDSALAALATVDKEGSGKQLEPAWLKLMAETYLRLWKTDDALRVLALLSERSPKDASVDFDRGKVYIVTGQFELAVEALKTSIEKEPGHNPGAYFELGKVLYQGGALEASETALLKAVEQDRNNPKYLSKVGTVALARGEIDEAIGHLQRAETAASAFPEIYFAMGRAYQKKGNRVRAEEYFNKFQQATTAQRQSEDKTQTVDRNISRGELKLDEGSVTEAQSFFEQAAVADPNRWEPHGYLAEMFLDSGDLDRAYPHLTKMEEIDPDSVVGNYLMARYSFARKDFERARTYAERVELSRPANSELRSLLGSIYEALGKKHDAMREYEIAVRLAPGRADFQDALRRIRSQEAQGKPAVTKP